MANEMNELNETIDSIIKTNNFLNVKKMTDSEFELMKNFIYEKFGISVEEGKRSMLEMKLTKVLTKNNCKNYEEYYKILKSYKTDNDFIEFLDEITVNKTDFFREINHFKFLKNNLRFIFEKNPRILQNGEIRIWSSASSTGEEPYTIAMVLNEILQKEIEIKILATDLDHTSLKKAIDGKYSLNIEGQIPPAYLKKYFKKDLNNYYISPEIKKMVNFRLFNLKKDFPFKNTFDIIFCRNVMIYFDNEFQKKLVSKFYEYTINGGLLFIGHSESLNYINNQYKYLEPTIYMK